MSYLSFPPHLHSLAKPSPPPTVEPRETKAIEPEEKFEKKASAEKPQADNLTIKKTAPKKVVQKAQQPNHPTLFALIVTACGGLLGTLLGGVGGFLLATRLTPNQPSDTTEVISNSITAQTLEAISKQPVYFQNAKTGLTLTPAELTATTAADNHYYQFTPQELQSTEPDLTFDLIDHQPNRNVQVRYQFQQPPSLPETAEVGKTTLKPRLNQVDIISPDGLNETFKLNEKGQPLSRTKAVKTDEAVEIHQWQYAYNPYNDNRVTEQHSVYPAITDSTGGGYYTAAEAEAKSVTFYEKVFDDTAGYLKEMQVLSDTKAERLIFDEKGKVIKQYDGTKNSKQSDQLKKRLQAIVSGEETQFEQFYNNHLTFEPVEKGIDGNSSILNTVKAIYSDVQILEREAAAKIRGWLGFDKLTHEVALNVASIKPSDAVAMHPKAQLTSAMGDVAFVDGKTLLTPLSVAWQRFKNDYHNTNGANVKQPLAQRLKSATEAFKQTSTGQKVGLAIGAILGGGVGIWALFPKKPKKAILTTDTN